jgi:hypothetical protein
MYSYWQVYRAVWRSYSPKQKGLAITIGLIVMNRAGFIIQDLIGYLISIVWRADALLFSMVACVVGYVTYRVTQVNEDSDSDPPNPSSNGL